MIREVSIRGHKHEARSVRDTCAMRRVTIIWNGGLHERPSAVLVARTKHFRSKIAIGVMGGGIVCIKKYKGNMAMTVNEQCDGIVSAISLGAVYGRRLRIEAMGPDAKTAVDEIVFLFSRKEEEILEDYKHLRSM